MPLLDRQEKKTRRAETTEKDAGTGRNLVTAETGLTKKKIFVRKENAGIHGDANRLGETQSGTPTCKKL